MFSNRYRKIIDSLANRNMAMILFVSFASGLPLALSGSTLQAWLATHRCRHTNRCIFFIDRTAVYI